MEIQRSSVGKRMSQAVSHNGTIYLAGQVAEDTRLDITGQTRQALAAVDSLLSSNGSNRKRILSVQIFLKDMTDFGDMNEVWDAWIAEVPGCSPARATVQAAMASPDYLVEIVVVAAMA